MGEIIMLEQYLRMVSPELQIWIREHDPGSAMEAAKLADVFVVARRKGQPWSYNSWKTPRDSRKPPQQYQSKRLTFLSLTPIQHQGLTTCLNGWERQNS